MNDDTLKPAPGDDPDRRDVHEPDGTARLGKAAGTDGGDRTDSGTGSRNSNGNSSRNGSGDMNGPDGGDDRTSPDGMDDGMDEDSLRRLLHGAVGELEPSPDSLEHLRRAVPARRTRRRQALVGAAAAVVLSGAALPALVHVATTGGSDDRPAIAGSSHNTPGTDEEKRGEDSGGKETGRPADQGSEDKEDKGKDDEEKDPSKKPEGDSGGVAPDPSSTLNATSPTCARSQLGNATGTAGTADAEGRVYGAFQVLNISGTPCTVVGGGSISPSALGGADASRVFVVDHTSGDAASGLPDPATAPGQLILKPGQAYEVRFAWIPQSGGGTSGCSNTSSTPSPDPTPDSAAADGEPSDTPGDGSGSGSGGGGGGGGEQPAGSVALSYTPEAGDPPAASVTLSGACAGTIYRTGVLAGA
ncbi:hypothetical protein [Streptomyces lonegramiae]|uniref:DUF4232 domain-containing protein n=1 Tax=Streptomyces lonegramiae TaxID=3075524 RepID=A0ABU2XM54_9ACTN|nr:hypothetical protein [Streptomyces sp. DSM 41529]MDT0546554.1 hypothetical protein [Streptomyces sp. DSM 41529]